MKIPLEGKTILITGASSGIGAATAKLCVDAGMRCVIAARRKEQLENLAQVLGELCIPVVGDVTMNGFNEHLLEQAGDVYAIFANAGHGLEQTIALCNMEQFSRLFELNVFAAVELASLAAKQMVAKKRGHIIFCASCLSKFATPQHGAYCASKSALEAIAKSMRMELRGDNIFVSTVHPIGTQTEFFDASALRSGKEKSEFETKAPSWLMQPPERVAKVVVQCLQRPKPECWTSFPMHIASTWFAACPRFSEYVISKFH